MYKKNYEPLTLIKCEDGAGSLQFSMAEFKSGKLPKIKLPDLIDLVNSLGEKNQMKKLQEEVFQTNKFDLASAEFSWQKDFVKI